MENIQLDEAVFEPVRQYLPNHIGVIYATSTQTAKGREFEQIADCEVVDVAHAIQAALCEKGYHAQTANLDPYHISSLRQFDWVVNLAETIYGFPFTDYEVAGEMERLNIHFTGSGSHALKACLDKAVTKAELMRYGVLTPAYNVVYPGERAWTHCRYPVIVKPVHEDGSIGITSESIARDIEGLVPRVEKIHHLYHQGALVEEFIEGRDIGASILGNGEDAVVLPLSEVTYPGQNGSKFLTFDAKWAAETTDYQAAVSKCPSELDPQVETAIKHTALLACRVMGCRDYARVDFRLRGADPYVLEVNPNPCINPDDTAFVNSGKAAGIGYADLIHRILLSSVKNHCRMTTQYPTASMNPIHCHSAAAAGL
jgi:D-alanine-D-alanine ligase